jgi:hypothetical protein
MSQQFHLDRFEECFIHHMARKLVGKAGLTDSDLDDIKQDLRADVLGRDPPPTDGPDGQLPVG